MNKIELEKLYKHSKSNEIEIMSSSLCGCFYCERLFKSSKVKDFQIEKNKTRTAYCPYCGVDSVIGDFVCKDLDSIVLNEMHKVYFKRDL